MHSFVRMRNALWAGRDGAGAQRRGLRRRGGEAQAGQAELGLSPLRAVARGADHQPRSTADSPPAVRSASTRPILLPSVAVLAQGHAQTSTYSTPVFSSPASWIPPARLPGRAIPPAASFFGPRGRQSWRGQVQPISTCPIRRLRLVADTTQAVTRCAKRPGFRWAMRASALQSAAPGPAFGLARRCLVPLLGRQPAAPAGRTHPLGILVETRGMGWNFPIRQRRHPLLRLHLLQHHATIRRTTPAVRPGMQPVWLMRAQFQ